jgi:hypothetical protein
MSRNVCHFVKSGFRTVFAISLPAVIFAITVSSAQAEELTLITNRDFSLDLYEGTALGSSRLISMGGASVALAEGSAGSLSNPSASAVRAATDNDWFSWDFHIDAASARFTKDYDNNGVKDRDLNTAYATTGGLAFGFGSWGTALTFVARNAPGAPLTTQQVELNRIEFAVSKWIRRLDLAIGIAVRTVGFTFMGDQDTDLFSINASTLTAGATWIPSGESFRIAGSLAAPSIGGAVETANCDPLDCQGFILPNRVAIPFTASMGASYRFAESPWNMKVSKPFRDERSITITGELTVGTPTRQSFGVEAFGQKMLQRSGAHAAVSPRIGVEAEYLPGRLRLRAGSYWEPARFSGVGGRLHGTAGFELAAFGFRLWGPRRATLTLTMDAAKNYGNGGISVGLWH